MTEKETLIQAITDKKPMVAMVAPSFPIVFPYPGVISMLKKIGFAYTVEVAVGAKKTNEELKELLKANPDKRYITSPCPTVVRMIRTQMPEYEKYLTHGVDSPMVATAKIVAEKYPGHQPVFIGPCIVKKLEGKEDYPELNILVLTYAEIADVFAHFHVETEMDGNETFDLTELSTRIYPLDGGLSHSSGLEEKFAPGEIQTVSQWQNCLKALKNFDTDTSIRLIDILYCDGGCIGGPGIKSPLAKEERKKKILDYYLMSS
jgi:iron only hydrogenase large subunit-like protein